MATEAWLATSCLPTVSALCAINSRVVLCQDDQAAASTRTPSLPVEKTNPQLVVTRPPSSGQLAETTSICYHGSYSHLLGEEAALSHRAVEECVTSIPSLIQLLLVVEGTAWFYQLGFLSRLTRLHALVLICATETFGTMDKTMVCELERLT